MEENYFFTVVNDDGSEVQCEALFTFERDDKHYIVYTDNTQDEDGNTCVYASIYNPEDESPVLQPIETEEEWTIINALLAEIQEDVRGADDED